MSLLDQSELETIVGALIDGGIAGQRETLLSQIRPSFTANLPQIGSPKAQLLNDLSIMNQVERLRDGSIPLEIFLRTAAFLLSDQEQEKVIRSTLDKVVLSASGAPAVDLATVAEIQEKIIHTDDTVPFGFMVGGVKVAASVMKLRVPRFNSGIAAMTGGNQLSYLGTGWLLGSKMLITNHHVVNARNDGEPAASQVDLLLQVKGTKVELDFDSDGVATQTVDALDLLASDVNLDYAVVRIPDLGRAPLVCSTSPMSLAAGPVPVNIVQHPGGKAKRFGIRNNLVSSATDTDLRYFTDTESGSSGSPVLNDGWEVVALHKASKFVSGVSFQGKATAYVNIGTHIAKVIEHIAANSPAIAGEIGS